MSAVTEDGDQRASALEAGDRGLDGDEDFDEDEEDGFEFGDADEAMHCVEMAESSSTAAKLRAHAQDYEELAARKRKALAEEQPQRCGTFDFVCQYSNGNLYRHAGNWQTQFSCSSSI
jgi:general transcription factor 3C polypeptide 3 (transcription factor C subunit 4)